MEKPVYVNMSHGLVGSSDPAGACAVFGYHRRWGTGFSKTGPIFLVYMESYCISVVCKL